MLPARGDEYAAIHRSLLAGLLSSIAQRGDGSEYTAAGGGKFLLWPGSGVFAARPKWIVAAELVETTRRYLRIVARIDPAWIEPLATHLVTRSYSDPCWEQKSGGAMAKEKVTLYGLTIVSERRVRYSAIDPAASRELLIQHGLVEGQLDTRAEFFRHNRELLASLDKLAAKTRKREIIVDPHVLYRFYDARLPADVCDAARLEKWLREAGRKTPRLLLLSEEDLVAVDARNATEGIPHSLEEAYPDQLEIDRLKLPLAYRFEPGAERDGITLTVPLEGMAQLLPERLEWLIPGMVKEKIEALIRSLPKSQRRSVGPAPELARQLAGELPFGVGPLAVAVAAALSRHSGERITAEMFQRDRLPPHLQMLVRVVDQAGKSVVESRDLAALRRQLGDQVVPASVPADSPWHRDGITRWDFGRLPESLDLTRSGIVLTRYPAVVDAGESVSLRHVESAGEARSQSRAGVLRLFVLAERRELKAQVQWLPQIEKIRLFAAPLATSRSIEEQLIDLLAARAFYQSDEVPRDADDFDARRLAARKQIVPAVQEIARLLLPLFQTYHEVRLALEQRRPSTWQPALDDIRRQLAALTTTDFLRDTPWIWFQHFPRYLQAILLRLGKLAGGLPRDRMNQEQIAARWEAYEQRAEEHRRRGVQDAELARHRWLIEELRVSLFAQELGVSVPVSPQRLDKHWEKIPQ